MDKLKKDRSTMRRLFTRAANSLEATLKNDESTRQDLVACFKVLEDKADRLFKNDELLQEEYGQSEVKLSDEEETKDLDETESYREKWLVLRSHFEEKLAEDMEATTSNRSSFRGGCASRSLKLPKLELKKFDGNVKHWIAFWAQFKRIHEDVSLEPEDKFQYLYQATEEGSSARELIASYPPSAENYPKAIEQLKTRFARDELLINIHVRELLQLVLKKAATPEVNLRGLYDKLETQLRALETLGVTANKYAAMLYPLVESALPEETLKAWGRSQNQQERTQCDSLEALLLFLRQEVEREERLHISRASFSYGKPQDLVNHKVPTAAVMHAGESKQSEKSCIWCNKSSHVSQDCFKAKEMSRGEKLDILRKRGACFNCLLMGHTSKVCRGNIKCLLCYKRHHAVMCPKLQSKGHVNEEDKVGRTQTLLSHQQHQTLLQTLMVKIEGAKTKWLARVLLDSGSQRSYITKDGVQKLGLKKIDDEKVRHYLFGGVNTEQEVHGVYNITLHSLDDQFKCIIPVLDKDKICTYVPRLEIQEYYPLLKENNIILSDVGHDVPEVKILLGADVLARLFTGKIVELDENMSAFETKLGWTVMGQRKVKDSFNRVGAVSCLNSLGIPDLWQLDTIGITDPIEVKTKENLEMETLQCFKQTVKVREDGRYEVRLPFKEGHPPLSSNKEMAKMRLVATTKKLKDMNKYEDYDNILCSWLKDGIIERVTCYNEEEGDYYLPHRAVIKESSMTTKIRPVFDASAKDKAGNSLNSCLEKGPNLIEKIPQILIQFRKNKIGVIADIEKAFLQISLNETDRNFLRFLWWEQEKLIEYRHCRVVFGVSSSPFLLGATISHHLDGAPDDLKATALKLQESFYVDNCVTSVANEEELNKFVEEADKLMTSGSFKLRGWVSGPVNCFTEESSVQECVHVLGLIWNPELDQLSCEFDVISMMAQPITKRKLLSVAQRIFDPIGYTCPTTLVPKLLLQEIWKEKYRWDEELPAHLAGRFIAWVKQIHWLKQCDIPRAILPNAWVAGDIQLHIFCDASKHAFATCAFLRTETDTEVTVKLVQAKTRLAPIKTVTIPRLELLAAVIGTRMSIQIKQALKIKDLKMNYWTDSAVVLAWIKRNENWSTFVGNRCKEICCYSDPEDWHHVPGERNPADLPSRGCTPKTLFESRWWQGPEWLKGRVKDWPREESIASEEEVNNEKRKGIVVATVTTAVEENFVNRLLYFSQYTKMVRMIGWILRFYHNLLQVNKKKRELTFEEVQEAEIVLLRMVQSECFTDGSKLTKNMQLLKDERGLMRVKTKLNLSEEVQSFKTPVVLSGKHVVTTRLIMEQHRLNMHAGLQTLLAVLRETYWIVGARKAVKQVINKCTVCKRHRATSVQVPFAALPKDRVGLSKPYEITGVDYAGPLFLKSGEKAWIVLFTCAVYRAVHLELVQSLSTASFIQALRRFVARRGRPSTIWSDNGTNFVGTNRALHELDWKEIVDVAAVKRILWKFNPPTASWWGGWWERLVRMVKELMRRNLGQACLQYEELYTVLCDCEAVINARPLTYVMEDTEELIPLTPASFLQTLSCNETPDLDAIDSSALQQRWKYLQKLRQDLRSRFRTEYLALLVHYGQRKERTVSIGDVVLVGDDSSKRINWPLGIILDLYPGADGVSRVARLKTAVGERVRPLQRLYPLEISSNDYKDLKGAETVPDVISDTFDAGEVKTTRSGRKVKIPERLDL